MNLLIRLFIASIAAFFKPKIRLDAATRFEGRAWPWDYDIQGHMTNTRFVALADLAIFQFLLRSTIYTYFARHKILPVVLVRDVKFKRMLQFPRKYTIHTRMAYWEDEYYCWRQVFEEGGKYAAEIYTVGVLLKQGTKEKIRPIDVARDVLQEDVTPLEPNKTIQNLIRRARERPELEDVLQFFDA